MERNLWWWLRAQKHSLETNMQKEKHDFMIYTSQRQWNPLQGFYELRNISKLRPTVPKPQLEMIIYPFISSRPDYSNSFFMSLSKTSMNSLNLVQNAAAKLLNKSTKRSHVTPILMSLHWLPIKFRLQFKILVILFTAMHGDASAYIEELLQPYNTGRTVRFTDQSLLFVPRTRLKTKEHCASEVLAPSLWNALPLELRSLSTADTFKEQLKTHLFIKTYFYSIMSLLHCSVFVKHFVMFVWKVLYK